MNEDRHDIELLRAFTRRTDQPAFAAVVRRHMDLVYATALRKLSDEAAAEEVAQDVFSALARAAWQFGPSDSVPAWLYRVTLLKSKQWLRGEIRRRRREQAAAELGTTMKNHDEQAAFGALIPLLDEGLLSLREKDRTALLLRYYESGSLAQVGAALGVNEDAARKRVGSALEQLVRFFHRRGFKTVTVASTMAALEFTSTSTPAMVATAVLQGAMQCAPPAGLGMALLSRVAGLTHTQTAALCLALVTTPIAWQWHTLSNLEQQTTAARAQAEVLRAQNERTLTELNTMSDAAERLEKRLQLLALSRNDAMARKVEDAKSRIRGLLTDPNYDWPEDLPFVRIPKSALRDIQVAVPLVPPGTVRPAARDLLSLTPGERKAVEQALAEYYQDIGRRLDAGIYETNNPAQGPMPTNLLARTQFEIPPVGKELEIPLKQLVDNLKDTLGGDRWSLLEPQLASGQEARRALYLDTANSPQQVSFWIDSLSPTAATVGFSWSGPGFSRSSSGSLSLREFLPKYGLNREAAVKRLCGETLPDALAARIAQWLTDQATTHLPPAKP